MLITCTYRGQEFIRIGYYVNNEYTDPELRENPPIKPDYTQVRQSFDANMTVESLNYQAMNAMQDFGHQW